MEWIDRLNNALDYLEDHLTEPLDPAYLAQIACCSAYHFQRMFTYLAGVPLSEYVRRRKMSLAAVDLQSSDMKIIDVAEKYGYTSPTAFNRAFQALHGIAPSAARHEGATVKSYPRLHFVLSVKGAAEMNYRIESRAAFRIVGKSAPLQTNIEDNFMTVPALWQTAVADGTLPRLAAMMDTPPLGLLGVSTCGDAEQWRYFIAVSTTQAAGDLDEYLIPAATWAIFPGQGTNQSVQELERRIITEWLPTSGYEYANAPDIEVYLNPDPQNAQYEVWIPVSKK